MYAVARLEYESLPVSETLSPPMAIAPLPEKFPLSVTFPYPPPWKLIVLLDARLMLLAIVAPFGPG